MTASVVTDRSLDHSFAPSVARHDITIAFDGITVTRKNRTLIENASGTVRGGRLTAIVSTCGTRTDKHLLYVLAAQEPCAGSVMVNGSPTAVETYQREAVIIDEALTAMDELTVRQNIQYSAEMRVADRSRNGQMVGAVVEALRLDGICDRPVMRSNIYGRRRVMVGKELVLNPAAIFVDNVSDGLATHEAKELLFNLRDYASRTGAVMCVSMMHPRLTLLQQVDDVIVMHRSHVVFVGTVAQWVTATINEVGGSPDFPEAAMNTLYTHATTPSASLDRSETFRVQQRLAIEQVEMHMNRCAQGEIAPFTPGERHKRPPMVVQFFFMVKYSILQIKNNILSYLLVLILCLLVAILLASVYSSQDQNSQAGMQNRVGLLFFLVAGSFFINMLFVEQQYRSYISYQRHRAHGYFSVVTYFLYWLVSNMFWRFTGGGCFVAVLYCLARLHATYWRLDGLHDLVIILAMTSFSCCCIVWLTVCVAPTTRISHFVLFGIYAFSIILAGLILNLGSLPRPLQTVSFASVIRLGYESAIVSQFEHQSFGCHRETDLSNSTLPLGCQTGDEYIATMGFSTERQWHNISTMSFIALGLVVLIFAAMCRRKGLNN